MIRWSNTMIGFLLLILFTMTGCTEEPVESKNSVVVSRTTFSFGTDGGESLLILETDAEEWFVRNNTDWVTVTPPKGEAGSHSLTLSVTSKTITARADTLLIFAGTADAVEIVVSQEASEYIYELTSNIVSMEFQKGGSSSKFTVTTTAPEWAVSANVDWLTFNPESGDDGETVVTAVAAANEGSDPREGIVTVVGPKSQRYEIEVFQIGEYYPSYNTNPIPADDTGMQRTAAEIAADMKLGWNIGNTLEAQGGETAWGNPEITEQLIQLAKSSGFNAIRLPCAWDQYLEDRTTAKIKTEWLDRVKQVVQYCINNDMYVILNIHWDGGWLENNVSPNWEEANVAKQRALWEQIATHLRDYDDRLMFAGTNEPNVENATQQAVLDNYLQTFIDAVRSTGGRNTYRTLIVQGPSTDIEKTEKLVKTLPNGRTPDRLMMEVHFYTPYQFCLMMEDASWGKVFYYWGKDNHSTTDTDRNPTWGEEAEVDRLFAKMKTQFVDKGIPMILGEYGAVTRSELTGESLERHLQSRAYYMEYVTRASLKNGMIPFYWGAGLTDIYNRRAHTVKDQMILDALVRGATE